MAFWAVALLLGLLALPLAFALLRRLPDAGAGLAIPLGLLFAGYGYFLLRTLSVLPAGRGGDLLTVALLALLGAAVAGRDRRFATTLRRVWPAAVAGAGLFTLCFFAYVAFRSYQPDINGTEQPMDFMYLNTTVNSPDYPPADPWLSGHRASYYYFGYLQAGLLTSASGVPPSTGYNLSLGYTFAAAATAAASVAFALGRWLLGRHGRPWVPAVAALAVVMLLGVGSLAAIWELLAAHGVYTHWAYRLAGLEWLLPCSPGQAADTCYHGVLPRTAAWYPTQFFWWFNDTRVIPRTITEFPFFSFLLGDLHPHVMSIPLALLSLGLSAAVWRGRSPLTLASHRRPATLLALGVVFGALAFQNAWDVLTFTGVLTAAVFVRNLRLLTPGRAVRGTLGYVAALVLVAVVAYAPWYVDFRSQASGFYAYVGEGTQPNPAFLTFGPLWLAAVVGLTWTVRRGDWPNLPDVLLGSLWVPLLPFLGWILLAAVQGNLNDAAAARGLPGWITLAAYGVTLWLLVAAFAVNVRARRSAAPVLGLAAVAVLLLFGAELFYIKDVFSPSAPRLNTVFKLSYQAWILLALAGAALLVGGLRAALRQRTLPAWLAAPAAAVLAAGLVYPVAALPNRTEGFDKDTALDGLAFVARYDPAEFALIRWVEQNTPPDAVVVEASGRVWRRDRNGALTLVDPSVDYTDAARVSSRTGRPTLVGWFFHEIQWRGDTTPNRAEYQHRQELLDSVYTSGDPAAVLSVLRTAGARYVILGRVERQRYPADALPPFDAFLDTVFTSGDLHVYALPVYRVVRTS
ncbi:MAG: hypothetical protein IT304_06755 [Dehalococcoidia bacterium]|nr:hypothetical protein [Dehalococcoidia bacterium]